MCLERPRHSPEEGGTSVRVVWPRADEGAQPGGEAARLRAGRRLLLDGGEMQPRLGSERQPRGSREAAEVSAGRDGGEAWRATSPPRLPEITRAARRD